MLQSRDEAADEDVCGAGNDAVLADPADAVAADCESVDRVPVLPSSSASRTPSGTGAPAAGGSKPAGSSSSSSAAQTGATGQGAKAACRIPSLKGATLAKARKRLRKAGCKVGKVIRRHNKTVRRGRIVKSSPKPGMTLAPKAPVAVVVSRGPRRG